MTVPQCHGRNVDVEWGRRGQVPQLPTPRNLEKIFDVKWGRRGQVPQLPPPRNLEKILNASTMHDWWRELRESVGAALSQLHWDILDFCKVYELTSHEIQLRRDALEYVERAVHEIWPCVEIHLFGSIATGLALPWSDIDVAILWPRRSGTWQKPTTMTWLSVLSRNLNRHGKCQSTKKIPHAKVPLLQVVLSSGISCDISFDVLNTHTGVSMVRYFTEQHETFRPLCLVLKFFLGQNRLNHRHTGGLGSFCLINMVASHIQNVRSYDEGCDLGTLLLSFFARYSNIHNYRTDVVSTRADFCGSKETKGWMNFKNPELLAVEDPLDPNLDIGKGSFRIHEVRMTFSEAHIVLLTHWHHQHVLAQLIDTTGNPHQRPKQEERKNERHITTTRGDEATTRGDEEETHRAPKVQKTDHRPLKEDSGVSTPRCLRQCRTRPEQDVVKSAQRIPPQNPAEGNERQCRTRPEQDVVKSAQRIPPQNPAEGNEFLRRSEKKIIVCDFLDPTSAPKNKRRQNQAKKQHATGDDAQLVQKSNPQHPLEDMHAGTTNQDESLLVDFWESHLNPILKSRKVSLTQPDTGVDGEHAQPAQKIHPRDEGRVPQPGSHISLNIQDEKLQEDFWEAHLTTKRKSRDRSLQHHGPPGDDIHCNPPQDGDVMEKSQDVGTLGDVCVAPRQGSAKCSPKHITVGENEEVSPAESSQNGRDVSEQERILADFWKTHLSSEPRQGSLKDHGIGDKEELENVLKIHPEPPPHETVMISQDERKLLDFWEKHVAPTLAWNQNATGGEEMVEAQPAQRDRQRRDAVGRRKDDHERTLADFWEAHLTPGLKSKRCSSKQTVGEEEETKLLQTTHLEQPAQGSIFAGRSKDETTLSSFWEACINPGFSKQGHLKRKVVGGEYDRAMAIHKVNLNYPQHVELDVGVI